MANRNEILNSPETSIMAAIDGRFSRAWTALPGIIQSVDFVKMTVSVQPAIRGQITNEAGVQIEVDLPLLVDVPIVFPSAGGFSLTLPVAQHDEVLVVFSSRCIDAWWQSGGVQKAMEARMHDLSDGFAIPGISSQPNTIPNINTTEAQLRTFDGLTYLAITPTGMIKMVADSGVEVQGNLIVTGGVEVAGDVIGNSETIPISLVGHTHTSATPGNPTGPPLP